MMEGLISFLSYPHFAKGKSTIVTELYTQKSNSSRKKVVAEVYT